MANPPRPGAGLGARAAPAIGRAPEAGTALLPPARASAGRGAAGALRGKRREGDGHHSAAPWGVKIEPPACINNLYIKKKIYF